MNFHLFLVAAFLALCATARAAPESLQNELQAKWQQDPRFHQRYHDQTRRHHAKHAKRGEAEPVKQVVSKGEAEVQRLFNGLSKGLDGVQQAGSRPLGKQLEELPESSRDAEQRSLARLRLRPEIEEDRTRIDSQADIRPSTRSYKAHGPGLEHLSAEEFPEEFMAMIRSIEHQKREQLDLKQKHEAISDLNHYLEHGKPPVKFNWVVKKATAALALTSSLLGLINLWFSWNNAALPIKNFVQPPDAPALLDPPARWVRDTSGNLIPSALIDSPGTSSKFTIAPQQAGTLATQETGSASQQQVNSAAPQQAVGTAERQADTGSVQQMPLLSTTSGAIKLAREIDAEPAHHTEGLQRRSVLSRYVLAPVLGLVLGAQFTTGFNRLQKDHAERVAERKQQLHDIQALQAQLDASGIKYEGGSPANPAIGISGTLNPSKSDGAGASYSGSLSHGGAPNYGYAGAGSTAATSYDIATPAAVAGEGGALLQTRSTTDAPQPKPEAESDKAFARTSSSEPRQRSNSTELEGCHQDEAHGTTQDASSQLQKRGIPGMNFWHMKKTSVIAVGMIPLMLVPVIRDMWEKNRQKKHPTQEQLSAKQDGEYGNFYGAAGVPSGRPGDRAVIGPAADGTSSSAGNEAVTQPAAAIYASPSQQYTGGLLGETGGGAGGGAAAAANRLDGAGVGVGGALSGASAGRPLVKRFFSSPAAKLSDSDLIKAAAKKSNNKLLALYGTIGVGLGALTSMMTFPRDANKLDDDSAAMKYKHDLERQLRANGIQPNTNFKPPQQQQQQQVAGDPADAGGDAGHLFNQAGPSTQFTGGILGDAAAAGGGYATGTTVKVGGLLGELQASSPTTESSNAHAISKRDIDATGNERLHDPNSSGRRNDASDNGKRIDKRGTKLTGMQIGGFAMVIGGIVGDLMVAQSHRREPVPLVTPNNNAKGPVPRLAASVQSAVAAPAAMASQQQWQMASPSTTFTGGLLGENAGSAAFGGLAYQKRDDAALHGQRKIEHGPGDHTLVKRAVAAVVEGAETLAPKVLTTLSGDLLGGTAARVAGTAATDAVATAATREAATQGSSLLAQEASESLALKNAELAKQLQAAQKGSSGGGTMNTLMTAGSFAPMALPLLKGGEGGASAAARGAGRLGGKLAVGAADDAAGATRAASGLQPFSDRGTLFSSGLNANAFTNARGLAGGHAGGMGGGGPGAGAGGFSFAPSSSVLNAGASRGVEGAAAGEAKALTGGGDARSLLPPQQRAALEKKLTDKHNALDIMGTAGVIGFGIAATGR
ncbi:uncharacterized protein PSFLO_01730 [Pseudozyma flocculosa]|uniref:Uncharacterized protein n=1 Tax=Pseudozyma flocculosa TaxID=84751 RepID=A0A5C3EYP5_9BASI|nr:uncharacterized protein PSFLO_01730 [Pseudozyma flocculosa]